MLCTNRRGLGVLILCLGLLVTFSLATTANALTRTGGGPGAVPTDPQFGAGGGGPGGNGWSDPDEYGIYSRTVPTNPNVTGATPANAATPIVTSAPRLDLRLQVYAFLYRLMGGLTR